MKIVGKFNYTGDISKSVRDDANSEYNTYKTNVQLSWKRAKFNLFKCTSRKRRAIDELLGYQSDNTYFDFDTDAHDPSESPSTSSATSTSTSFTDGNKDDFTEGKTTVETD